jgi:hypothetical protein
LRAKRPLLERKGGRVREKEKERRGKMTGTERTKENGCGSLRRIIIGSWEEEEEEEGALREEEGELEERDTGITETQL